MKDISKDEKEIIFVYNADSGIINSVKDYFHKIVKPSTYACNLCNLTFNNTGMRREWKDFIDDIDEKVEFLHRDEFKEKYHLEDEELPAVFEKENSTIKLLITKEEINGCDTLDQLMNLVKEKI